MPRSRISPLSASKIQKTPFELCSIIISMIDCPSGSFESRAFEMKSANGPDCLAVQSPVVSLNREHHPDVPVLSCRSWIGTMLVNPSTVEIIHSCRNVL